MYLGYARPLQENDLFELQDDRKSAYIGSLIMKSWDKRTAEAEAYNVKLANGEIKAPLLKRIWWDSKGEKERLWREKTGRKEASLIFAMNDSIKWWFWSSGIIKVIGDTAQVTSPLLVKVRALCLPSSSQQFIRFLRKSSIFPRSPMPRT